MKSVDISFTPSKLCVYRDELWVGAGRNGVFVYNSELQKIKQITNKNFQVVNSILKTDTDVIVCDKHTGLHLLNQQGDYLNQICAGHFSDVSVTNNTLFALEFRKEKVHLYTKFQNSWVKDRDLHLSDYSEGCDTDRLCTTSTHIYVSCYTTHFVCVYSLSGELLYKQRSCGLGKEAKVRKFYHPILSDVDSGGQLLLCDCGNHRLQVSEGLTKHWAKIKGLEEVGTPWCAGVGHRHLWVGNILNKKLVKYEAQ